MHRTKVGGNIDDKHLDENDYIKASLQLLFSDLLELVPTIINLQTSTDY
jgi:hypothetical protein